ncbi:hypothetical protein niasHS_003515 [Heterodera schachtii]|uniref:Transmembrane protein n=1 Tax=Heterodera schachtii TaxID=97005 RepID=A0ABD2KGR9_HETSC
MGEVRFHSDYVSSNRGITKIIQIVLGFVVCSVLCSNWYGGYSCFGEGRLGYVSGLNFVCLLINIILFLLNLFNIRPLKLEQLYNVAAALLLLVGIVLLLWYMIQYSYWNIWMIIAAPCSVFLLLMSEYSKALLSEEAEYPCQNVKANERVVALAVLSAFVDAVISAVLLSLWLPFSLPLWPLFGAIFLSTFYAFRRSNPIALRPLLILLVFNAPFWVGVVFAWAVFALIVHLKSFRMIPRMLDLVGKEISYNAKTPPHAKTAHAKTAWPAPFSIDRFFVPFKCSLWRCVPLCSLRSSFSLSTTLSVPSVSSTFFCHLSLPIRRLSPSFCPFAFFWHCQRHFEETKRWDNSKVKGYAELYVADPFLSCVSAEKQRLKQKHSRRKGKEANESVDETKPPIQTRVTLCEVLPDYQVFSLDEEEPKAKRRADEEGQQQKQKETNSQIRGSG